MRPPVIRCTDKDEHCPTHGAVLAVAAHCCTAALGWLALQVDAAYAAGVGEERVVVVHDGTPTTLNTPTPVRVAQMKAQRSVTLLGGGSP